MKNPNTIGGVRINNEKVRLYTFGSPKCVDKDVVNNVSIGGHSWRFRNNNDLVTKVPPIGTSSTLENYVLQLQW